MAFGLSRGQAVHAGRAVGMAAGPRDKGDVVRSDGDEVVTKAISDEREIENLIARYAFLVDDGDFKGLGALLAQAKLTLNGAVTVEGADAIERLARTALMTYEDGTPRTSHVTTNIIIEIGGAAGTAQSRSYYTVLQSLPDFPLQPIAAGRYRDEFRLSDGKWVFASRSVDTDFVGDVSRHRRG